MFEHEEVITEVPEVLLEELETEAPALIQQGNVMR